MQNLLLIKPHFSYIYDFPKQDFKKIIKGLNCRYYAEDSWGMKN